MKKVMIAVFALALVFGFQLSIAQSNSNKELKKEIKNKAVKQARKEARGFKRDGYYVAPGALPMDKQIEEAWMKQYEDDESGFPKYIVASGNSVAETQSAAKLQATELAKLELAGTISTQIAALIENSVANQQLNNEDAATVTKTVAASKNIIAQELGRIITLFEIYRKVDKNIETNVRIAYNSDMAKEAAKNVVRKRLEEETEIVHEKLEKMMNF